MSDLLHVSKSLSTTLSFQMETLYSQISPHDSGWRPRPHSPAQQAVAVPMTGFCLSLQEGKEGGGPLQLQVE